MRVPQTLLGALVALAIVATLGAVAIVGGFNVAASAGHLPGIGPLMHFTMRNSVRLRAGSEVPVDLDDEALIALGANHYQRGCAWCHGAPGQAANPIVDSMLPRPPAYDALAGDWEPAELYWIVRNGIKMTGMPGWPDRSRDEEPWAVVAFLGRIGAMTAERYRELTEPQHETAFTGFHPPNETVRQLVPRCAGCHGRRGDGLDIPLVPRIDGQSVDYLAASIDAYARGARASGYMHVQVSEQNESVQRGLAEHYGSHAPLPAAPVTARFVTRGAQIALDGIVNRDVPACAGCHGPSSYPQATLYPRLAGQRAGYLRKQLELFREGQRGGTPHAHIMQRMARGLSDDDIVAVSAYYAALPGTFRPHNSTIRR